MKKVTISVKMIHSAYMVLSAAKFSSLADADKKKLLLIARAMKPVSTDFSDFAEDARKALKPTDDYDQKIVKWEETRAGLNAGESENLPMSQKEFREFLYNVITPYNNLVKETLETEEKKEKELEFEPISKEAFDKLASVNITRNTSLTYWIGAGGNGSGVEPSSWQQIEDAEAPLE